MLPILLVLWSSWLSSRSRTFHYACLRSCVGVGERLCREESPVSNHSPDSGKKCEWFIIQYGFLFSSYLGWMGSWMRVHYESSFQFEGCGIATIHNNVTIVNNSHLYSNLFCILLSLSPAGGCAQFWMLFVSNNSNYVFLACLWFLSFPPSSPPRHSKSFGAPVILCWIKVLLVNSRCRVRYSTLLALAR